MKYPHWACRLLLALLLTIAPLQLPAQPPAGTRLPELSISERGELWLDHQDAVRYRAWSTAQLPTDRVTLIMYLPGRLSSRPRMKPLQNALEREEFPANTLQVVSIVNLDDASFGAGMMVGRELKLEKQRNPEVQFVVDADGLGLALWQLQRKRNAVLLLDHNGKLVHGHVGEFSGSDVPRILARIHQLIATTQTATPAPAAPETTAHQAY